MNYGQLPFAVGKVVACGHETFNYQSMPIKLNNSMNVRYEMRLLLAMAGIIRMAIHDYILKFGPDAYEKNYVYVTAKRQIVTPGNNCNRPGWHSDGFMTKDINYIWSDCYPTIFNSSKFELSMHDYNSMIEMEEQADPRNNVQYGNCTLLRLNQYNIHRTCEVHLPCVRTFIKISFSPDKYDLQGNTHNYELDYKWDMRPRLATRNIPQKL